MTRSPRPPRVAEGLLRARVGGDDYEAIAGDLHEIFVTDLVPRLGLRRARRWYWRQVMSLCTTRRRRLAPVRQPAAPKGTRMAAFQQDVSYAIRALRKQPGFALTAVTTLALAIGANVAIFAVLHALLLKPLPFAEADRLMLVHLTAPFRDDEPAEAARAGRTHDEMIWSYPKYDAFRDQQRAFEATALFAPREWSLTDSDNPERLRGELVGARFFEILGRGPAIGRAFVPAEDLHPDGERIVLIGHGLWTRRFGGDPAVLGRTIGLNKQPHTIVGVMPAGFRGMSGQADVWVPLMTLAAGELNEVGNHSYWMVARRKPGVSVERAAEEVKAVGLAVHELYRDSRPGLPWSASATPIERERTDPIVRRALYILLGAVGVVLLIGCANLASLMIARTLARQREVAVRLALGASRLRIVRQFLTESLLVSLAGAAGGLAIGWGLLGAARAFMPDLNTVLRFGGNIGYERAGLTRTGIDRIGLDWTVLLATAGLAALAAILVGLAPAWQAARHDLTSSIKAGGAGSVAHGTRGFGFRNLLVAAEIALALMLVVASGLMLRTVAGLDRTPLGFDPDRLVSARFEFPPAQYDAARATRTVNELIDRLQAQGEVEGVAYGSCAPVTGYCNRTKAEFPDQPAADRPDSEHTVAVFWASPAYFSTMRIGLVRGRLFTEHDRAGQPKVVVVNETAARRFWGGADPIGRKIALGQGGFQDGAEVVGVVRDVRYGGVDVPPMPDAYLPLLQSSRRWGQVFIKSRVPITTLVPVLTREVRALDRDLPLVDVKTMDQRALEATWRSRALAWLLSLFGGLALLLAAVGVFGVMAQAVEQRTREIGVRMALGASPRDVVRMVVGRAARVSAAGVVAGFVLSVFAMRTLATLLFEVEPDDPLTFWTVAAAILIVSMIASYLPARRAARVDPLTTMRAE
jgi:predicted permease